MTGVRSTPAAEHLASQFVNVLANPSGAIRVRVQHPGAVLLDDGFAIAVAADDERVAPRGLSVDANVEWLAAQFANSRFKIQDSQFTGFAEGDAVYRFFELFDLANVPSAKHIFELAAEKKIRLTPAPKPVFEEKMLFALLWNRNLKNFWRQELGEGFYQRLLQLVPYTWIVDPAPLPPQAAIPELNLTDWSQLKTMSQKELAAWLAAQLK